MWGKVNSEQQYLANLGITPTHVGKSRRWRGKQDGGWDHPHPCGEKQSYCHNLPFREGSPPPMWGKGISAIKRPSKHRITPTHVGKSRWCDRNYICGRDHPHPCGEKCSSLRRLTGIIGSPPPMWGKVKGLDILQPTDRITPTHVGKSLTEKTTSISRKDHPHPCGEKTK